MAQFKTLKLKKKEYIFKSFGNDKIKNSGKAIFFRFPFTDELFPVASQKNILESSLIKDFDNSSKAKEKLVKHIIDGMIENISNNRFDYLKFLKECISHFENLQFDGKDIKSVEDFLTLPQSAVEIIAKELYNYSKEEEKFEMGE
jgi:hypothetical protein